MNRDVKRYIAARNRCEELESSFNEYLNQYIDFWKSLWEFKAKSVYPSIDYNSERVSIHFRYGYDDDYCDPTGHGKYHDINTYMTYPIRIDLAELADIELFKGNQRREYELAEAKASVYIKAQKELELEKKKMLLAKLKAELE